MLIYIYRKTFPICRFLFGRQYFPPKVQCTVTQTFLGIIYHCKTYLFPRQVWGRLQGRISYIYYSLWPPEKLVQGSLRCKNNMYRLKIIIKKNSTDVNLKASDHFLTTGWWVSRRARKVFYTPPPLHGVATFFSTTWTHDRVQPAARRFQTVKKKLLGSSIGARCASAIRSEFTPAPAAWTPAKR